MSNEMTADMQGKIAVVTGSAQGIGKSIAESLSRNGATVVVSDVKKEEGQRTSEELGGESIFIPCNISDAADVESLVDSVVARFGRIDVMVNNAGINTTKPEDRVTVDRFPLESWNRVVEVDLNGTFYCCRAAAAQMVKQNSGSIVNIASVAGVVALRLQIAFVAAKAAIIKMTEAMACELGPLGIRVNAVSPGSTLTAGTKALFYSNKEAADHFCSFIPQGRPGETDEIAQAVLFLASDAGSYVNGHNLIVDGGWTRGFNRDF